MKRACFFSCFFFLSSCGSSTTGAGLCSYQDEGPSIVEVCGISESTCLERLRENPDFVEEHVFINPAPRIDEDTGACIVDVRDLNSDNAALRGWNDAEPRQFFLGLAVPPPDDGSETPDEVVAE